MSVQVAEFVDLRGGTTGGQFTIGDRKKIKSISDLDPMYLRLMDEAIPVTIAVMGNIGRPNLTPMWFDYEGDQILINVAEHRKKTGWLRKNPQFTMMLINPKEMYHWIQFKGTVVEEIHEDNPVNGPAVIDQLNKISKKYINVDEYPLRDPSFEEKRVLFKARVDNVATFGVYDWDTWDQ